MEKSIPTFLTIRQTAAIGVLSEHHLRLMEKQGRLPGIRTGKTFRMNFEMLLACWDYLEAGEKSGRLSPIESVAFASFMPDMAEAWTRYLQRIHAKDKPNEKSTETEEEIKSESEIEKECVRWGGVEPLSAVWGTSCGQVAKWPSRSREPSAS